MAIQFDSFHADWIPGVVEYQLLLQLQPQLHSAWWSKSLSRYIYNDYSNGTKLGCFSAIPEYALKNLPDRLSTLRQPTIPNLDATLQKSFPLTKRYRLTFRADAFNLTNSVLFSGPNNNPADGPPTQQGDGSYTGFGR